MTQLTFLLLLFFGYIFFVISISTKNRYVETIISFLFILFFASIAAVRFSTVPDTNAYINHYNDVANLSLFDFAGYPFEPGYVILIKIHAKLFGGGVQNFFFFLTVVNFLLVSKSLGIAFRAEKDYFKIKNIAILYYASYYGLYFNFIVLRFGLGASFFLLALVLSKTKKIYSILCYVLCAFCHSSFLIFLPLYIFLVVGELKIRKKTFFYVWLGILILIYYLRIGRFFTMASIQLITRIADMFTNYDYYLNNLSFGNSKIGIRFSLNILLAFIFVKYNNFNEKKYILQLTVYFVGLSIYALFSAIELIDRVSDICLLTGIYLIPTFYSSLKTLRDKFILFYPVCIANMIFAIRIIT